MPTATSTMPRPRSPSPSTLTSKSKHQHNISEHCRQQISFFSTVCFAGYNEWQEGSKPPPLLHYTWQEVIMPTKNTYHLQHKFCLCGLLLWCPASFRECHTWHFHWGRCEINFAIDEAVCQLRQSLGQIQMEDSFDITLTSENTDVPQSSAALYRQHLTQDAHYWHDNFCCCTWCKH